MINSQLQLRKSLVCLTMVMLMAGFSVVSFAQFAGGDGTAESPFQVNSLAHLQLIANEYVGNDHADVHYIQTANIDIGGVGNWDPIGTAAGTAFHGNYDGDGFEIQNMRRTAWLRSFGLFGFTGPGAVLENIHLTNIDIVVNGQSGTLVARANNTVIRYCSAVGQRRFINANQGGLVGYTEGNTSIFRCWVDMEFTDSGSGGRTGGIVGWHAATGAIEESFALVEMASTGANDPCAAGLVGRLASGSVLNSYVIGHIRTTQDRGRIGGLVGDNSNRQIVNSYAIVSVDTDGAGPVGGLVAQGNPDMVTASYWNLELTGIEESPGGGELLTTEEMFDTDNYEDWDFDDIWNIGENTFPFLAWEGDEPSDHNHPPLMPPQNLVATVGDDLEHINLTWDDPSWSLDDPTGYHVYRDRERINDELLDERSFRDDDVEAWEPYMYTVTAVYTVDGMWEESVHSVAARGLITGFAGGDGTAESPWLVANADHLDGVRFALDGHYRQTADIELEGNWTPIGPASAQSFTGNYDGDGHTITGLQTARAFRVGMFAYTDGATLKNMHLEDANVQCSHESGVLVAVANNTTFEYISVTGVIDHTTNFYFGGIAGRTTGNTSFHRCWTDVESRGSGRIYLGNLAGQHGGGAITESFTLGSVTSTNANADFYSGGFVGRLTGGSIINSYSMTSVIMPQDNNHLGGFVGDNMGRPITNCYSIGTVQSTGNNVGGFVGRNTGQITNSYWSPDLSGMGESAGGEPRNVRQLMVEDTYNEWDFDEVWSIDDNSMAYLAWEGDEAPDHAVPEAYLPPSGLEADINEDRDAILITWDEPSLAEPIGYHVYRNGERINAQMVEDEQFNDTNVQAWIWYTYQATAIYVIDGEEQESDRSGGVRAIIDAFAGGSGTADDPYLVADEAQLRGVANILDAHFRQTADIDLQRQAWDPIGDRGNCFEGFFDGDDYLITDMHFDVGDTHVGLFGYTDRATLNNIHLVDVDIRGGRYVGALVGYARTTTINNCSSSGRVRGTGQGVGGLLGYHSGTVNDSHSSADVENTGQRTGGFVGDSWGNANRNYATGNVQGTVRVGGYAGNDYNGSHNQVFATGNVTGTNEVGGLFGLAQTATYNDCYALGNVEGNDMVGGWVGNSAFVARINRGYSIGRVEGDSNVGGFMGFIHGTNPGNVTASYWNVRTSGQEESVRGEGRDERHMTFPYTEDTYEGWNFNNIWQHDEEGRLNDGYPYHQWHTIIPQHLDTPEVEVAIITRDDQDFLRITWDEIDDALSYKIYAHDNPDADFRHWEEVDHVGELWFEDPIDIEESEKMFYRVVASIEEPPGE